jgi:hypothetical protein
LRIFAGKESGKDVARKESAHRLATRRFGAAAGSAEEDRRSKQSQEGMAQSKAEGERRGKDPVISTAITNASRSIESSAPDSKVLENLTSKFATDVGVAFQKAVTNLTPGQMEVILKLDGRELARQMEEIQTRKKKANEARVLGAR